MMTRHDPDVVLLDIDMPELDGTEALPRMLAASPSLQVVMMSTLTTRNADISLKCLALGAVDYIAKPESNRGVTTSEAFRTDLIERVRVFGAARARGRRPAAPAPASAPASPTAPTAAAPAPKPAAPLVLRPPARSTSLPRVLLIGSSTGGPKAVNEALAGIGAAALRRVPTLIVQHMPPVFTAVFADISPPGSASPPPRARWTSAWSPAGSTSPPVGATWASRRHPAVLSSSSTTGRR